ncbi:feruloyl-CoA synthase [Oceanibacterium hippocampi]|uniref:Carboxylic acid reductase n=1 Tax=Oceanibacterium hippocampi TaxID=745714 RepID=A0A1Y5T8D1_9PROT|nr:feruloyl-CoA synthase [Oceanibacterium hippocampi]SLN57874.1 Carboxylic acid reductase [Oceanibacterium hippocampi]
MNITTPYLPLQRPAPAVTVTRRPDGVQIVECPIPPGAGPDSLANYMADSAARFPDRTFIAERGPDHAWREISFGAAWARSAAVAEWLIRNGAGADRPVFLIAGNSIAHALLMLGALRIGVALAPVSVNLALLDESYGKLRHAFNLVRPDIVFVDDGERMAPALTAIGAGLCTIVSAGRPSPVGKAVAFDALLEVAPGPEVAARAAAVTGDTVAKILFTSGSTGLPKAVINNHRMLTAAQGMAQAVAEPPDPENDPLVLLDWLPWHHTFGGNAHFNLVMRVAGTLYIDDGRPVPGLFEKTIENLREISPTRYSSVPTAYGMLVERLEEDQALRERFFSRLRLMAYGGASLAQDLHDRMQRLAVGTVGCRIPFMTGWGSTETAAVNAAVYWNSERVGLIGLPIPGASLKLVPVADKFEVRVRGPHIMPGYFGQPELDAAAFDEDGYYRIGDAVRWLDPAQPERGLAFAGRVGEDFKLATGTWVHTGALRVTLLESFEPFLRDLVIAGHDREAIGILAWPNLAAAARLAGLGADAGPEAIVADDTFRRLVAERLAGHNRAHPESSLRIGRMILLADPPSIEHGEITDEQYVNQRAVLERRADKVAALFAESPATDVLVG